MVIEVDSDGLSCLFVDDVCALGKIKAYVLSW